MVVFIITVTVFWPVTAGILVLVFWIYKVAVGGGEWLLDFMHGRASRVDTAVRCPRGHIIETEGDVYQCDGCGWVYMGSILVCENVECNALTLFLNCHECGLSVRNPYRWGRP